ncbi:PREDICTED: pentatricopeptide repeat-containing protein At5g66520-like [Nelumbo nucifera]|uniref:Pentatricopeptide repeat-containing protein At5g66520-like n=1 Tax=Nelumbo nucifera TaxID=4432 RepID=A0A1U8AH74_NELNU|nr:PREDICTED: pentatricopeptide repeat-containing protein At5g66520-like [Nelumbo nucifera]
MTVSLRVTSILSTKPPQRVPTDSPSKAPPSSIDALILYHQTLTLGRSPNKTILISAIKACTLLPAFQQGIAIHAQIIKTGFHADRFLASTLVCFYSAFGHVTSAEHVFDKVNDKDTALWTTMLVGYVQNGDIDAARRLFGEMPNRDVVAWNAMLSGYSQSGMPKDAIQLFREMQIAKLRPTDVTLVSALSACSQLGCLSLGEWIHAYIERYHDIRFTSTLVNSLVHMYGKCGRLDIAYEVFLEKGSGNLESWNAMLTSFAIHGCGMSALSLFCQMMKMGLMPDRITFMAVLMACSHGGLVDHAYTCFACMSRVYGLQPRTEHYGCLVDVLSRKGLLKEANMIIEKMPVEPDSNVWGALLGGCLTHQNYELGLIAAARLLEQESYEESRLIALSNLYVMAGKHEEAVNVRKMMLEMGIKKSSGSSLIEVDGIVHEFLAGDRSHRQSVEIYSMVETIDKLMCLKA